MTVCIPLLPGEKAPLTSAFTVFEKLFGPKVKAREKGIAWMAWDVGILLKIPSIFLTKYMLSFQDFQKLIRRKKCLIFVGGFAKRFSNVSLVGFAFMIHHLINRMNQTKL